MLIGQTAILSDIIGGNHDGNQGVMVEVAMPMATIMAITLMGIISTLWL
jgi:hypothetical protein